MDKEKVQQLSAAEVAKSAHEMDPQELQQIANCLSLDQILAALPAVNEDHDAEWNEKTIILLLSILNIRWLELAGKVISPMQFKAMLEFCHAQDKSQQWKLSPLVVGMQHEDFSRLLEIASDEQLSLLKHEGMAEPLQFQLKTLSHEWLYTIERYCSEAGALEQEILALNLPEVDSVMYQSILNKIEILGDNLESLLQTINKALALSWNTNRIDLIEKLSLVKELAQKTLYVVVGNPRSHTTSATGLYSILEIKLGQSFGNINEPDALKDEDPPLEALGKFSLWHLEDYWECGLLPKITRAGELHLDSEQYSTEVCENHRIKLLQEAQKNLEALGLRSVKDFKLNGIWSAKLFKEFVQTYSIKNPE